MIEKFDPSKKTEKGANGTLDKENLNRSLEILKSDPMGRIREIMEHDSRTAHLPEDEKSKLVSDIEEEMCSRIIAADIVTGSGYDERSTLGVRNLVVRNDSPAEALHLIRSTIEDFSGARNYLREPHPSHPLYEAIPESYEQDLKEHQDFATKYTEAIRMAEQGDASRLVEQLYVACGPRSSYTGSVRLPSPSISFDEDKKSFSYTTASGGIKLWATLGDSPQSGFEKLDAKQGIGAYSFLRHQTFYQELVESALEKKLPQKSE